MSYYDDGFSNNALVRHYQYTNVTEDHSMNCAWGAGADCTCGKIDYTCTECEGTGEIEGAECKGCDGYGTLA